MSTSLPERPNLDQLRRQAKELRDAAGRGDPPALDRLARHPPSGNRGGVSLAAAQLVVARELGHWQERHHFVSNTRWWPPFCACVDWVVALVLIAEIAAGVNFHT